MTSIITEKPAAKPKLRSVSFKVEQSLHDELDSLRKRVRQHDHEVDFNLDLVLAEALQKNIKAANKHLDILEKTSA